MNIVTMPLSELNPAHYNPRVRLTPEDKEYQDIKSSLGTFGLVEPLVWNQQTRRLVGGHQRLQVLLDTGYTEAPVSVVDLDQEHEQALNVALNHVGGRWDFDTLPTLLERIAQTDLLAPTGYTLEDVGDFMRRVSKPPTLDQLEQEYQAEGEDDDAAYWPKLVIPVPRPTLDRFRSLLALMPGTNEAERLVAVCEVLEWSRSETPSS